MKIALINPPFEQLVLRCGYCSTFAKSDYYWPPLDLLVQSGFLTKAGHDISLFDFNVTQRARAEAVEDVVGSAPDGVLVLVGSGSWRSDVSFAVSLKDRLPSLTVVLSGGVTLYNPRDFLANFPAVDGILMDFTQDVLGPFISGVRDLPHLAYRRNGEVVIGAQSGARTFSYPPGRHDLLPLRFYRNPWKNGIYTVLLTSFGCPFSCTFCNASDVTFKYRLVDEIIDELRLIASLGIREVMFRDLNFVTDKERTRGLCRKIIDYGIRIGWFTCVRADALDEETVKLMKGAGCHTLHIGVESASEEMLRHYQKNVDLEKVRTAFSLCRKYRIKTLAFFIIGLPGETEENIERTISFAKALKCDFASFNIASPLYGTKLRQECLEQGYIQSPAGLEELETSYQEITIETPLISREAIHRGHQRAVRKFYLRPAYLMGRLLSIRSVSDMKVLVRMAWPIVKNIGYGMVRSGRGHAA